MPDFARARRHMVDGQLRTSDVTDIAVLEAFDTVPREAHVRDGDRDIAYLDRMLVVGGGEGERRVAPTPLVLARMIQAVMPVAGRRVLHVACGLGYGSALLARLGARVRGLESVAGLAQEAERRLRAGGYDVAVDAAPLSEPPGTELFDVILVEGAFGIEPTSLTARLAPGGCLVGVSALGSAQRVVLRRRAGEGVSERVLFDAMVPVLPAFAPKPEFVF